MKKKLISTAECCLEQNQKNFGKHCADEPPAATLSTTKPMGGKEENEVESAGCNECTTKHNNTCRYLLHQ
ncbi:hypothetical protein Y032_0035g3139 [Ancylostoma ceylanicum]|uniref:Uncharacterized protein n=1 Tax=Ancylostoma ceylanicum TaxID=53326 RepID=A0A016UMM1_9BILA|nr:hypothetical protein Y032_0035g3139 [Ancylostoma ceylanicum]